MFISMFSRKFHILVTKFREKEKGISLKQSRNSASENFHPNPNPDIL
jgi:hypothetical protein